MGRIDTPTWWIAAQSNLVSLRSTIPFLWRGHVRHDVLRPDGSKGPIASDVDVKDPDD